MAPPPKTGTSSVWYLLVLVAWVSSGCVALRDAAVTEKPPAPTVAPADCTAASTASWPVRPIRLELVDVKTAENRNLVAGIPFGYQSDRWLALVAAIQPGDRLYFFGGKPRRSDGEDFPSWRAGYGIVRECALVHHVFTVIGD